jgi:hypothetical protein
MQALLRIQTLREYGMDIVRATIIDVSTATEVVSVKRWSESMAQRDAMTLAMGLGFKNIQITHK